MNGDITAVDLLVLSHANTPRLWSVLCSVWKGAMYTVLQEKYLMSCPWIVSVQKTVLCVQLEVTRSRMERE